MPWNTNARGTRILAPTPNVTHPVATLVCVRASVDWNGRVQCFFSSIVLSQLRAFEPLQRALLEYRCKLTMSTTPDASFGVLNVQIPNTNPRDDAEHIANTLCSVGQMSPSFTSRTCQETNAPTELGITITRPCFGSVVLYQYSLELDFRVGKTSIGSLTTHKVALPTLPFVSRLAEPA